MATRLDDLVGGLAVISQHRLRLTLPAFSDFDIRVAETVRLVVPGAALTSGEGQTAHTPTHAHAVHLALGALLIPCALCGTGEDVPTIQLGIDEPPNQFVLLPDAAAAESLEVVQLSDGDTRRGALRYFSERWYTVDTAGAAAVVLRVDAEFNAVRSVYGALDVQVWRPTDLAQKYLLLSLNVSLTVSYCLLPALTASYCLLLPLTGSYWLSLSACRSTRTLPSGSTTTPTAPPPPTSAATARPSRRAPPRAAACGRTSRAVARPSTLRRRR